MTQSEKILAYLKNGNYLTPTAALNLFSCFRLSARINDLRKDGHDIKTEMVDCVCADGHIARVARYYMPGTQDEFPF